MAELVHHTGFGRKAEEVAGLLAKYIFEDPDLFNHSTDHRCVPIPGPHPVPVRTGLPQNSPPADDLTQKMVMCRFKANPAKSDGLRIILWMVNRCGEDNAECWKINQIQIMFPGYEHSSMMLTGELLYIILVQTCGLPVEDLAFDVLDSNDSPFDPVRYMQIRFSNGHTKKVTQKLDPKASERPAPVPHDCYVPEVKHHVRIERDMYPAEVETMCGETVPKDEATDMAQDTTCKACFEALAQAS